VVVSLVCVALGVLATVDVAGAHIAGAAYLAVPLAIIGLGLVVGAWMGRARWLILPGLVLMLALASTTARNHVDFGAAARDHHGGDVTWAPSTVDGVQPNYHLDAGNGTLDLSRVDFTDRTVDVNASIDFGNLVVILPPKVDTDVSATVHVGDGQVLGQQWSGFDKSERHLTDNGADGPGGGHLNLTANVNVGKLEVHR
jgi:hypothetical protein